MTFEKLYTIIKNRLENKTKNSYTASLFDEGIDRIIQKVGEEGVEVVIAAKNNDKSLLIGEIADLYFHLSVLMVAKGITIDDVLSELERRNAKDSR